MKDIYGALVPTVLETTDKGERSYDIYSRLLKDRIIVLHDGVHEVSSSLIVAQLLFLEAEDPTKDITLYINSPGGSVTAGLAIYDTMQYIKCDVVTVGMGMCASMGAFLLSSGTPGKRFALPRCTVMIHQVSGGYSGQTTDAKIHYEYQQSLKDLLNKLLSEQTGQPYETVVQDTERDNFLTAEAAKAYGLVDEILVR